MKSASLACALHRKSDGRSLASALHIKFETPAGLVCKKRIRGRHCGRFRKYNEMRKFSVRLANSPRQIWRGRMVA